MLLGYFVFSYIEMFSNFYYTVCFQSKTTHNTLTVKSFLKMVTPQIGNLQNIILTMTIVVSASRVKEKVKPKQILNLLIIIMYEVLS